MLWSSFKTSLIFQPQAVWSYICDSNYKLVAPVFVWKLYFSGKLATRICINIGSWIVVAHVIHGRDLVGSWVKVGLPAKEKVKALHPDKSYYEQMSFCEKVRLASTKFIPFPDPSYTTSYPWSVPDRRWNWDPTGDEIKLGRLDFSWTLIYFWAWQPGPN